MFKFDFITKSGKIFSGIAKDEDRARIQAKKVAGSDWVQARLYKISNAI